MKMKKSSKKGFTLTEVMMVMVLSILVFSAMASAMIHAFRLWDDGNAHWKLAQVARRTRVIYLDGARNRGDVRGSGMLAVDQAVDLTFGGTNASGYIYDGVVSFHCAGMAASNEMSHLWLGADTPFNSTNLSMPYYLHQVHTGVSSGQYWEGTAQTRDWDDSINDSIWFADFSTRGSRTNNSLNVDMPENLYVRLFNPAAEIAVNRWQKTYNSAYFLSTSYELVYFSGGREYVHPEMIRTRFVNVHY